MGAHTEVAESADQPPVDGEVGTPEAAQGPEGEDGGVRHFSGVEDRPATGGPPDQAESLAPRPLGIEAPRRGLVPAEGDGGWIPSVEAYHALAGSEALGEGVVQRHVPASRPRLLIHDEPPGKLRRGGDASAHPT